MFQAVINYSNCKSYLFGDITQEEVDAFNTDEFPISSQGVYLILVDKDDPKSGEVLAKFSSEEAAQKVASHFRRLGAAE